MNEAERRGWQPDGSRIFSLLEQLKFAQRLFLICVGAALIGLGLEEFLIPNGVIDGGITGISIITAHVTGLELGLLLFVLNAPFLLIGYQQIGKTFALSTLISLIVLSGTTLLLVPVPPITNDALLASVFGGIVVGIGTGLVIRNGGSSDGTEAIAVVASKKSAWSIGQTVMLFNIFILGSAGFVFGWDHAMYSLIAYFIASKAIDVAINGLDETKAVWIISDHYRKIGDAMLHRLGRGVTYLSAEGGFSGDDKKMVFCVISRLEEAKMKSIVQELDSDAFVAIGPVAEVRGGRFKKQSIH